MILAPSKSTRVNNREGKMLEESAEIGHSYGILLYTLMVFYCTLDMSPGMPNQK